METRTLVNKEYADLTDAVSALSGYIGRYPTAKRARLQGILASVLPEYSFADSAKLIDILVACYEQGIADMY